MPPNPKGPNQTYSISNFPFLTRRYQEPYSGLSGAISISSQQGLWDEWEGVKEPQWRSSGFAVLVGNDADFAAPLEVGSLDFVELVHLGVQPSFLEEVGF
jgi:hypothetical protein